jgi:hypothetical protein
MFPLKIHCFSLNFVTHSPPPTSTPTYAQRTKVGDLSILPGWSNLIFPPIICTWLDWIKLFEFPSLKVHFEHGFFSVWKWINSISYTISDLFYTFRTSCQVIAKSKINHPWQILIAFQWAISHVLSSICWKDMDRQKFGVHTVDR